MLKASEKFLHEVDNAPKIFDYRVSVVRSDRRTKGDSALTGDRKGLGCNDRLSAGESKGGEAGYSVETGRDFEQEEIPDNLITVGLALL